MGTIPQIGAEYAGYRIDGLLGRGGMSVVFRAENPRLGNLVALKLLAPELAHDDMFRERFVRESRVAASINHPNIVPIYDFGDHDGLLYIVMRYVQGADLKRMIQRRGRLTPQQTVAVIAQAGRALDAAHARGLIHRDVKPANFLIEPSSAEDSDEHVYLADFGLTKHSQSKSGLTATGVFVGTIDYVAPEQISGGDVDARTDIYSMGCVIYECLTGHIPFEKDAEMAVLYAHVHEDPPGPSELQPELPAAINDVMRKALAKSPDDRYQSCRELVSAVADALITVDTRSCM
jgi:serine/threonine-protein kinase